MVTGKFSSIIIIINFFIVVIDIWGVNRCNINLMVTKKE